MPWDELEQALNELIRASHDFDCQGIVDMLKNAPIGFEANGSVADLVWCNGAKDVIPFQVDKVRQLHQ